ncbi:MAG TPA: hypothetical protein VKA46_25185 [Gemmataceae bacterium]|nr:hypothetical protein [Gemmataceae bacterium]
MNGNEKGRAKQSGPAPWPRLGLWRFLLFVAAVEALTWGADCASRPRQVFQSLGMEARNDEWAWQLLVKRGAFPDRIPAPRDAGLWQLLALLSVAQAAFLALAAWRPRSLGGLVVVPLIGHALGYALWTWALWAAATLSPARLPFGQPVRLALLAAHHAVWLPLLLTFLLVWRRRAP